MPPSLKTLAKAVARHTLGRLPPSSARLTGTLARDGGARVRDTRLRPWPKHEETGLAAWALHVRPALREVALSGSEGLPQRMATEFAARWAKYCGCRFGLMLPHGTDSLRIALAAALDHDGLDHGGEVILPNLSFIASVNAALDRRFGVVLVDVDPGTLLLDPARVEEAIVPGRTRAIMPVHLFGQPADMLALRAVADRHGLKIIEDAAQAHGSALDSGPSGSLGDAAGFSFQSFKNLSCGEGGALTTNDEALFERAYALHNVGRARVGGGRWEHLTLGWNCRPTEYQAALLLDRMGRFEAQQARRRENFGILRALLRDVQAIEPLAIRDGVRHHGCHMFVVRYKAERCGGLAIQDFLNACGSEGLPLYRGYEATMSEQPAIQKVHARRPEYVRVLPTPVADAAVQELAYLPQDLFLGTEADMGEIFAIVRKVESHYARRA